MTKVHHLFIFCKWASCNVTKSTRTSQVECLIHLEISIFLFQFCKYSDKYAAFLVFYRTVEGLPSFADHAQLESRLKNKHRKIGQMGPLKIMAFQ